jgi:hypothetical protein
MYQGTSVRVKKEIVSSACLIAQSVSKEFLDNQIIGKFFFERCK